MTQTKEILWGRGSNINQQNGGKPELVFWFDAPPRAGSGVFRFVAQEWGSNVYYISIRQLRQERRIGGWGDCNHGQAQITILEEEPDPDRFVRDFIQQHNGAIHICNGLRSLTTPYIKKHLFSNPNAQIAVWSERPGVYGNVMKKYIRTVGLPLMYRYYALFYGGRIGAYLPLGKLGVDTFVGFGWNPERLFPFMYVPEAPKELPEPLTNAEGTLRLLYVGRFARSTKGIDILINAINGIKGDSWRLDLVGGYGEFKDATINWAENNPNVCFRGIWPSDEICKRITQYDVCIVPSRFDGWNVVINEALSAGVGVISTDAAVSNELVEASGAGMVVPAGEVEALGQAIQMVIDNPGLADSWKVKAKAYSPRIRPESVGNYLIDVLEFTFIDPTRPRPVCPWL